MEAGIPKLLITLGLVLILAGGLYYLLGDKLQWLGRLPGDIRIEKENVRIYFPITTMILISVVFTVLLNVLRRFF